MKSHKEEEILDKVQEFVIDFNKKNIDDHLLFHNIDHTMQVVKVVNKLAEKAKLSDNERELLTLAAWFHDTGYAKKRKGHEEESVLVAEGFLTDHNYPEEKIAKVSRLIRCTAIAETANNKLEELLKDADLSHIGTKRFFVRGELLRAELETTCDEKFTELEWQEKQYNFLISHSFITREAENEFGKRRNKNIKKQRENTLSAKKTTRRLQTGKDFGRGIDTLYRSTYRSHINFSAIADGKANMMISINTILISVIVTLSGASLSVNEGIALESLRFTVPILILLLSSLISVVFAVTSARPKVTEKKANTKEINKKKTSMLFFGNFLNMSKDDYIDYLSSLKNDQQGLYDSMSMDIYDLGKVLKEKYRLLAISYNVFMVGLSLCVVGFILIFLYTNL